MTRSDDTKRSDQVGNFQDVNVDALLSTVRRARRCRQTRNILAASTPEETNHQRNGCGRDVGSQPFFQGHSQSSTLLVSLLISSRRHETSEELEPPRFQLTSPTTKCTSFRTHTQRKKQEDCGREPENIPEQKWHREILAQNLA